jgi:S-adenosylmethionine:tRNA-ribosyltransferase-isomerase (queuine synthetase)
MERNSLKRHKTTNFSAWISKIKPGEGLKFNLTCIKTELIADTRESLKHIALVLRRNCVSGKVGASQKGLSQK